MRKTNKVFLALKSACFLNQVNIQKTKLRLRHHSAKNDRCLNYFQSFLRTLCSVESFEWHLRLSCKTLFPCAKVLLLLLVQGRRMVKKSEGADFSNSITTLPSRFSPSIGPEEEEENKDFRRWEQGFRDESVPFDSYRVSSNYEGGGSKSPSGSDDHTLPPLYSSSGVTYLSTTTRS